MKTIPILILIFAASAALALPAEAGRETFMRQQAYAEMQRVAGQVDILDGNLSDLTARVEKLENAKGDEALRAEIATLRATVEDLKRQLAGQRGEIVRELGGKITQLQKSVTPPPAPAPVYAGPVKEYTVQKGDTLSLIAEAFGTTVSKLRAMNALKNDTLQIGQKLRVPGK